MKTDIREVLRSVLATKLGSLSPDEARAEIEQARVAPHVIIEMYALTREVASNGAAPSPRASARPGISLKAALVEVMRATEKPLTSHEIVDRVIALRPNSEEASIRSEISRARKEGVIALKGDPRGGTYTAVTSPSVRAPAPR